MVELRMTPQARKVLSHLEKTGWITERSAIMDHSVQRLSARISELRDFFKEVMDGRQIVTIRKKHPITGQRYAKYTLKRT